ncbi:MAG TPA: hypothetical protein PLU41_15755 [Acidobacteriota bacterium]|nr:hypothetical protein [Acidobacteriota bacterium]HQO27119.1 hypothetical protein [Acidobacteriota bacterium]HQP75483.1 hypothetical protein [Acidobacteriota bacterium]
MAVDSSDFDLLPLLRDHIAGRDPDGRGLARLLRRFRTWARRYARRSPAGPDGAEDLAADFLAELLAEDGAGMRYVVVTAADSQAAERLLYTMFRRHVLGRPRSILANKLRSIRWLLERRFPARPGAFEVFGPSDARTLSPVEFERRLPRWVDAWRQAHPRWRPVRGDATSSQLPVIIHAETLAEMVDFLYARADAALGLDQVLRFVADAADLVHYEYVYRLQEVPSPDCLDQTAGASPSAEATLEAGELDELAAAARAELSAHQEEYLAYRIRHDHAPPRGWFRERRISRASFYAGEFRRLKELQVKWRTRHPNLPAAVLDRIRLARPDGPEDSPILPESGPRAPQER